MKYCLLQSVGRNRFAARFGYSQGKLWAGAERGGSEWIIFDLNVGRIRVSSVRSNVGQYVNVRVLDFVRGLQ